MWRCKIKLFLLTAFLILNSVTGAASTVSYNHIQLSHNQDLNTFVQVKEGAYDPEGTYVLLSPSKSQIKVRMEDWTSKTDKEMEQAFQKKIFQFRLLFEERPSPYEGALTMNTECFDKADMKKQATTRAGSTSIKFDTKATKNFAYGKCDGEGDFYFSRYYLVLCRKYKRLYDVRYFSLSKNEIELFQVSCIK